MMKVAFNRYELVFLGIDGHEYRRIDSDAFRKYSIWGQPATAAYMGCRRCLRVFSSITSASEA